MKNALKIIWISLAVFALIVLLFVIFIILPIRRGNQEDTIYENGYFKYIFVDKDGNYSCDAKKKRCAISIVGFTESGKQQEVIDFPREIDCIPVVTIGGEKNGWGSRPQYRFEHNNLKKMYIHENIKFIFREALLDINKNANGLDVMLCSNQDPLSVDSRFVNAEYYIYKSLYSSENSETVHWANITFMNNYSTEVNGGYYSLDNVEVGEKIPVPIAPIRDGYEFTGWYTEPECINKWDFEVVPIIEENTDFKLYAGWRL